jgi:hypothetical protein
LPVRIARLQAMLGMPHAHEDGPGVDQVAGGHGDHFSEAV